MSLKNKLLVNAGWLFAGQTLQKVISYLIILLIGRTLGDVGLGQYSFIISFAGFVSYLSDFGINYYIMRELARNKKNKELMNHALSFKVLLAVLDWFLLVFLALHLDKEYTVKIGIILYGSASVFSTIGLFFSSIMFAHEVTKYETISLLVERVLTLLIGGIVLLKWKDLFMFLIVLTINMFISNFLRIYFGSKFGKPRFSFMPQKWIRVLTSSYLFWFIYIFSFIYYNTDIIMLGLMKTDDVVGWYKAGYFFIQAAMLVPAVVVNTALPSISRLWVEDKNTLRVLFNKAFQILGIFGILGSLGSFVLAPWLIKIFFGFQFSNSTVVLQILAWSMLPTFVNALYGSFLNGIGKEKEYTKIVGFSALLNVILNYILILTLSYKGAAIATVVTKWLSMLILSIKVYNVIRQIKR